MSQKRNPRDLNQLAAAIVGMGTSSISAVPVVYSIQEVKTKDPAAVALGRKGGLKGGKARAKKLSAATRSNIAKKAALTRWKKKSKKPV
ncbi:MAG: hypothetical protein KGJ18_09475 [Gammaproteobacteria bacterium]|nr:hypothetical protein [Gammaproteobacteria bacterium]